MSAMLTAAMRLISNDAPRTVENFKALLELYEEAQGEEKSRIGQCLEGFTANIGDEKVLDECMALWSNL
jgi:cyclophilin family peptidyl-prolyl cis-trans isomerase